MSLCIVLLSLSIVVLHMVVVWLNTESGGAWISRHASLAMQGSGYSVDLKGFVLSDLVRLKIASVDVLDGDGVFVSIEKPSLYINAMQAVTGHFYIGIDVAEIYVNHIPQGREKQGYSDEKPSLTLPSFVHSAELDVHVQDFQISNNIVPQGLKTAIKIQQRYVYKDHMAHLVGEVAFDNTTFDYKEFFPSHIESNLSIDTNKQRIIVDHVEVKAEVYNFALSGSYGLEDNFIDIKTSSALQYDQYMPQWIKSPIVFSGVVNGTINRFSGEVGISVDHNFENGDVVEHGSIQFDFSRADDVLKIVNMHYKNLPAAAHVDAALDFDIMNMLVDGSMALRIPRLSVLKIPDVDFDISGAADAILTLSAMQGVQSVVLKGAAQNIGIQGVDVADIRANVMIPNTKQVNDIRGDLNVSDVRVGSMHIKKTLVDMRNEGDNAVIDLSINGYHRHAFNVRGTTKISIDNPYDMQISGIIFESAQGRATLSGHTKNNTLDLTLKGGGFSLPELPFADLSLFPVILDDVSGHMGGTIQSPKMVFGVRVYEQDPKDRDVNIRINGRLEDNRLGVSFNGTGQGIRDFDVKAGVPLSLSLSPFDFGLDANAALDGRAVIRTDLQKFPGAFVDLPFDLTGDMNVTADIGGIVDAPKVQGVFNIKDASFLDMVSNVVLNNIQANGTFNEKRLQLDALNAQDNEGKGTLSATAMVDFSDAVMPQASANINLKNMHLIQGEHYDASLNADIALKTLRGRYVVSGDISPQNIAINLPDQFEAAIPSLNVFDVAVGQEEESLLDKISLDMTFQAENQVFVRGQGLDTEFQGELNVTGTAAAPLMNGNLQSLRGRYKGFGRTFDLDQAVLRFQGAVPPSPYLNIAVSTDINDIRAMINITDRVTNPKIGFSAIPALPEDEVLSLILFGEDIEKISPFQAIQLANTLRKFSGQGGGVRFDPLADFQNLTGIDDLRVDGLGSDNATVGAGKYLTEDVYLEVEQGTAQGSVAVSVAIEVTPNVSVESETSQNGETGLGIFWEREY